MQCVQASLDAFSEQNRALSQVVTHIQTQVSILRSEVEVLRAELTAADTSILARLDTVNQVVGSELVQMKDIRVHWSQWREGWEEKLNRSEVYMLRTISELNSAFQHRSTLTEESFRRAMLDHNAAFQALLAKSTLDVQDRLWEDLRRTRADFEKLIFDELSVIRQRGFTASPAAAVSITAAPAPSVVDIDWLRFADRFRGSEEHVRQGLGRYIAKFTEAAATPILDIGCGRGEFLAAARDAGLTARGIDLSEECVTLCRSKDLDAEVADLFVYLAALPDHSLGGVFCSQVIEHLPAAALPELIRLLGAKVRPGALVAFETPNPECLAIFATHFYLDPTHVRPVPAPLLSFYLQEAGFGDVSIDHLAPAEDTMPAITELPESFRRQFFGGLDYSVIARRL